jgi:hypothetical protein
MSNKPPFYWCHDEGFGVPAPEAHDDGFGITVPAIHDDGFTEDAADEAPQDGETYVSSWGEMLYEMTHGEMGTPPPQMLRRYDPKPAPRKKR